MQPSPGGRSAAAVLAGVLLGAGLVGSGCSPGPGASPIVAVGQGSYTTTLPAGARGPSNQAGGPATPLTTDRFDGPVPTNDWWTSLAWDYAGNPYSMDLYAHPLALRARAGGLDLRYPTAVDVDARSYFFDHAFDVRVGLEGLAAPDARVDAATDWTVTAAWDDGANRLFATFGHGLPFVYFTRRGADVRVTFGSAPRVWANQAGVVGVTVNGHHYGLFAPLGGAWTGADTLRSDLGGRDFFSVAVLPDDAPATLDRFRRHAFAFVTGVQVSWRYDEETATLTTTYTATTERKDDGPDHVDRALMALYRHQWRHTADTLTAYAYTSPRGTMKVRDGNTFSTSLTFGGVLPGLPRACNAPLDSTLYRYLDEVYLQEDLFAGNLGNGDTYWSGKAMARLAELVPLAEEVGHTEARDRFLGVLRVTLEGWLRADDGAPLFYYDDAWTTLIGFPAAFGSNTDLNDHHFHYGYHVQAAATLARYDPAWAEAGNWGAMVEWVAKDAANADRADARFPFLRAFDPYAGHSWASGHGGFNEEGNNQESSSEAMNFAAALVRWGAETGNTALRDLGIFLYVTERSAVEQYWFDVERAVFPAGFDHTAAAIVWGNGGMYDTWFGSDPALVHGINFLPFTGGSYYLGRHPGYVRANYDEVLRRRDGPPYAWPDLLLAFLALADPEAATVGFDGLLAAGYRPEDGETKAHTYRWIAGLRALGRVDTTVTAGVPTYAVFSKEGRRSYVAYNPAPAEVTVQFSDGFSMPVPARAMVTGCVD